jgi:nitrite reductase/ring-hydroxylating ferredoxin subunit
MDSDQRKREKDSWIDAGRLDDLPPGSMRRIDAASQRVLIANVSGTPLAVADTCTHEDASLSMGVLDGETVRCPLHGSRFCLRDGRAIDEPAEVDLACFAVRVAGGRLQVYALDSEASLAAPI